MGGRVRCHAVPALIASLVQEGRNACWNMLYVTACKTPVRCKEQQKAQTCELFSVLYNAVTAACMKMASCMLQTTQ